MAATDKKIRVLILGCGYLGTHLAKKVIEIGWKVTALTKNDADLEALTKLGVSTVKANLESGSWHSDVGGDFDFVVNCVSSGKKGIEGYRKSYVEGQKSILQWMQRYHYCGKFVYTSSSSVYPQYLGEDVDELADTSDASTYGEVLLESESIVMQMPADWTILRLSGIYGPERTYFIDLVKREEPISGEMEAYMNLVHVDDVVSAILACLLSEKASKQVFNVSDGTPIARVELARWIAQEACVAFPVFLGHIDSPRTLLRKGKNGKTPNRRVRANKIRDALGWEPIFASYSKGMIDLV